VAADALASSMLITHPAPRAHIVRLDYDYHPLTTHFLNTARGGTRGLSPRRSESRDRNVLGIAAAPKPKSRAQ